MTEEGRLKYIAELDTTQLAQAAEKVNQSFKGMTQTAEVEGNKIDSIMKKVGGAVAGYFTFQAAAQFANSLVGVRSQIESLEISFKTLLGSEQAAAKLFGEIREFAVSTPLQLGDLAGSAQTLLAFNIEAEKIMPTLRALGDISMGDSQKLQSLTLAFAQMSSAGKLMGQDLLQMINAGFNPLSEISKKTGKSIGELKDEMSAGKISVDMVTEAFMSATSEGGKFYGMLDKQSKGINGSISNLKGAIDDMLNEIGSQGQEAFVGAVNAVTNLVKNYKEIASILADVAIVYGSAKAAMLAYNAAMTISKTMAEGMTLAQVAQTKATTLLTAAQEKLKSTMLANPYALAAAAIAALVVGMVKLYKHTQEEQKKLQEFNNELNANRQSVNSAASEYDTLVNRLKKAKEGTQEYANALVDIEDKYGDYLENLDIEAKTLATTAENQNKLKDAILETAKARSKDAMLSNATSNYNEIVNDVDKDIQKRLQKLYPDGYANVYARIAELIDKGKLLGTGPDAKKSAIAQIFGDVSTGGANAVRRAEIIDDIDAIIKATNKYKQQQNDILNAFGGTSSTTAKKTAESAVLSDEQKKAMEDAMKQRQKIVEEAKSQIESGQKEIADFDKSLQLEIRQAMNDALDDGFTKTVNQIAIDYEAGIQKLEEEKQKILKTKQDILDAEAKKTTGKADAKSSTIATLTEEEAQYYVKQADALLATKKAKEKAINNAVLAEYRTYQEQRTAIKEEYENKRNEITLAGGTKENQQELNRKEQETLKALDSQIASRSKAYNSWMEQISKMSLEQLYNTLEEAQALLDARVALGEENDETAVLRAKVDELMNRIDALKQKMPELNQQMNQQENAAGWRSLTNIMQMADDAIIGMIGDTGALSDTTMEFVSLAITGLEKLATMAIEKQLANDTDQMADAANEAAKSFDNAASLIGLAIAAVRALWKWWMNMSEATGVVMPWNQWAEDLENATEQLDRLQNQMANWDIYTALGFDTAKNNADSFGQYLVNAIYGELDAMDTEDRSHKFVPQEIWDQLISNANTARAYIEKLHTGMTKLYGDDRLNNLNDQMQTYRDLIMQAAEKAAELRKQADETKNKTKQDGYNQEADELEQKVEENTKALIELMEQTVDSIIGTADTIATSLTDAFSSAFQNGTDAAKAWGDEVNKIVKKIATNLLVEQYLTPEIQKLIDQMNIIDEEGNLASTEVILSQLEQFSAGLNVLQERWAGVYSRITEMFGTDDRSATTGGFAQASQESIDELSGRATAIQGHTSTIAENTSLLLENSNAILSSVRSIESSVSAMGSRMNAMANDIETIKNRI